MNKRSRSRKLLWPAGALAVVIGACLVYAQTHPLICKESFWQHEHCIAQVGPMFMIYAEENHEEFPKSPQGYGDALLELPHGDDFALLTGPGYTSDVFVHASKTGGDVPEEQCGRVYIQGLSRTDDPQIVLVFDKQPSPGDHCHGIRRLWAPLVREILRADGSHGVVPEKDWPEFSKGQIALLVSAGIPEAEAKRLYSQIP